MCEEAFINLRLFLLFLLLWDIRVGMFQKYAIYYGLSLLCYNGLKIKGYLVVYFKMYLYVDIMLADSYLINSVKSKRRIVVVTINRLFSR